MQAGTVNMKLMADIMDVQKKFNAMEKMAEGTVGKIGGAFSGLGVKIAAALSVGAIAAWVKSGLDAADSMSKMAQKTGLAVESVGGLQLAFRQSGLGDGALESSMAKLNKNIVEGSKAFEAMGLSVRNTDGSLKNSRQMLGEVADQFARYEDGAAKAVMAQQLFGKTGAELIPLFNGGAKGFEEFDAMAAKLALTLDESTARAAEKFNDTVDLMGQGVKGIGMQVAAQLLPTLQTLADKLFDAMTAGDRMQNVTKALSFGLRILGTAFIALIEIISVLTRSFTTFATMARQALAGDFAGAVQTYREGFTANMAGVKDTLNTIGDLWTETGNSTVEAVSNANKAMRTQAPVMQDAAKRTAATANSQKALNAELDAYFKAEEAQRVAKERSIQSAREMVEAIEFETEALRMTNTEREIAIKLRELERQGIKQGSAEYEIYAKKIREAVSGREAVRASIDAQRQAREEWAKTWDQVAQSFTDALMQGGQSVKQYLQNLFRTMVLRPLLQPIIAGGSSMMAGVANAFGFGPESGGGMGSTMNLVSSVRSAYQAISGGFTALGNSVAFAADSMGAWLVNNTSGVLNQMGGSLMQSAGTLGTAASYLGGAAAGIALGTVISGGYSAIGKSGNVATIAGTAIGAFFGGPIGAAIGGAIGGVFNRAFGRKAPQTTGTGITGTFSTEGANVRQYEEWFSKGGWFRSNKSGVNYSAVSNELDQFLDFSLIQITQATRMYAQILGLNADAVNGVTQSVRISLMGLSAEQQQERIMQALGGFADLLAGRFGLTSETMAHLANSLVTANQVFETLNQRLLDTSLAAGDAASQLLELFGSVENFTQATSAYYRAFYTETERTAKATQQLTDVLAAMGFALPATRGEFRALVEAQDLMTTAGRQNYAALINLSQVFDEITPKLDTLAGKLGALVAGLVAELATDLDKQINASSDAARQARESARAYAEAARTLSTAAQTILGGTTSTAQSLTMLRQAFGTQMAGARGGNLDALTGLGSTATDLQQAERAMASTSVDFARQNALIALQLKEAAALAESSAASADYQAMLFDVNTAMLRVLKDSLLSGNASVELLQEQLGALQYMGAILASVDDGTQDQISITDLVARATGGNEMLSAAILNQLQVPDAGSEFLGRTIALGNDFLAGRLDGVISAINLQSAAQQAEIKRQQDLQKAQKEIEIIFEKYQAAEAQKAAAQQRLASTPQTVQTYLGRGGFFGTGRKRYRTDINQAYAPALEAAKAASDAAQVVAQQLEAQREAIRALGGVPAFASGGMHSGGLRLVGEHGPELEATGPSRIFNANQTAAMLGGGGEVATEIRALRQEVAMLRYEAQATAINTGRTQDLMKRVTRNGEAMTVQTDGAALEVTTA